LPDVLLSLWQGINGSFYFLVEFYGRNAVTEMDQYNKSIKGINFQELFRINAALASGVQALSKCGQATFLSIPDGNNWQ
jgi:hypothetical protein